VRHSPINRNNKSPASSRLSNHRSGAFMLELVVGAVLLGVFFSTVGPMFRWIHESKRANDQHLAAMQELSTQMEKLAALQPSGLTSETLQSLAISDSTRILLPDAELTTTTAATDNDRLQRVTLTLTWINNAGMAVEPKRLTAWFPRESKGETE
jgi:Tfp pilus assembly protein PilE